MSNAFTSRLHTYLNYENPAVRSVALAIFSNEYFKGCIHLPLNEHDQDSSYLWLKEVMHLGAAPTVSLKVVSSSTGWNVYVVNPQMVKIVAI